MSANSPARLWVTGTGLVTALGAGVDATWARLVRGDRALGPVELFDTAGQRTSVAGQVRDAMALAPTRSGRAWSRTGAMAYAAAKEAMDEARLAPGARVGLVVGVTTSGMYETESLLARLHADPQARDVLKEMLTHPLTSTGDRLVEAIGPFARVRTLCSACSSGANALLVAAAWLLSGELDAVVTGGCDGLCRLTFTGFNALAAMDPEPCRPFDTRRKGLTLGEGAGFVVLERDDAARARAARPIAELAGWATGAEAHHITNPEPKGELVSSLVVRALERARLTPAHLDYVNAHGTGTPLNDPMEAAALARALGDEVKRIPVSSSKAQIGHTLGAAGAIEGVITALCVARQAIVPTAGLDQPDPACALVHVPKQGRTGVAVRAALSNSFGFGGMDAVVVFAQPELAPAHESPARRAVVVTGGAALTPTGLAGSRASVDALATTDPADDRHDLDALLDAARARRLDRPAKLGAVVAARALEEAGAGGDARAGVVIGSAFGSVDASAAFMHRIFEKGPRFASPAEFPNLVPSSPVGHVSIYLGMHGPVFATADLSTSGESAIAAAVELVQAGETDRVVAGAVEERSDIVERVMVALFARSSAEVEAPRREGAAAVVVESEEAARARGAKPIARVAWTREWRGDDVPEFDQPTDAERAVVVLPRENHGAEELLARTPWRGARRVVCAGATGEHDGLGAVAAVVAAGLLARGEAREALVLGIGPGRGHAIALVAP